MAQNGEQKTILVTGATGRQGGATARHLLAKGWHVRALTRDPNQAAARALQEAGAEIVQGDFDEVATLQSAVQGVYGVFSVQASVDEVRQAKSLADIAKTAGVLHFVASTVQSADMLAQRGGDTNKWQIEQYIQRIGLPATILRPCLFMDDVMTRYAGDENTFAIAFLPDVRVGMIAAEDIGALAALAFERPDEFLGKTVEIGGDALTPPQIAAALSRALGRQINYVQIPIKQLRQQNAIVAAAFDYFNEVGYTTDIDALRRIYPGLMDFETWLDKIGKQLFSPVVVSDRV